MKNEERIKARKNEIGYCGLYCRTCCWYAGVSQWFGYPAKRLLCILKGPNWVAGLIDSEGGDSEGVIKGLEILSKSGCISNCKGGSGWHECPVRKCCIVKGIDFCFECPEFPCERNWGEKSEHANVFTADKIKLLQEMKKIGVEEWIKKQWEQ